MSEYVTIPREPTTAMTEAVHKAIGDAQKAGWYGLSPIEIYRTYLAAAPAPQGIGREAINSAVLDWVRDDAPLNQKMTWTPALTDKLVDRILALLPTEPPAQWQPIETAPLNTSVLLWSATYPDRTDCIGLVFEYSDGSRSTTSQWSNVEHTMWQPLPEPPAQGEG